MSQSREKISGRVRRFLEPLHHARNFDFGTYDIETRDGFTDLHLAMLGFFDGRGYTCFRSVGDFLNAVLTKRYRGWRFFAHFGGRFDVHYLWDWLRENDPGVDVSVICSGACVIAMTIRRGECSWRFCDSYRVLPQSLHRLTHDFDVPHKKLPQDFASQKYNEYDCRGLYEVLQKFFELCGCASETLASQALKVYRLKYMTSAIEQPSRYIEDFVRKGYYGGRCELFRFDEKRVLKYDVNSLFPRAMLEQVPVRYMWHTKNLNDLPSRIGFYRAEVDYPDTYLPILPCRREKLYFPIGKWEGVFTDMELREADCDGCNIKIRDGIVFQAEKVLSDFVRDGYKRKAEAKRNGDKASYWVWKLLLNSFYGKFGQNREQRMYGVDKGEMGVFPLGNGLCWWPTQSFARHILPHIAATVTARARLIQRRYLQCSLPVWYTDTDSVFTTQKLETGEAIGELHCEGEGEFQGWRSKEYRFGDKYYVKGVPSEERLAMAFVSGTPVTFERQAGFLESLRSGLPAVRRISVTKRKCETRAKRARDGDDTRPWNVSELEVDPQGFY